MRRQYSLNEEAFDVVDNADKAYWLGFIYADGSVDKYSLDLEIHQRDGYHLEKLRRFLLSSHPIKHSRKDCVRIRFSSKRLVTSLKSWGVVPNKTYLDISTPKIEEDLLPYFYRGIFDGDGWFTTHKHKKCKDSYELGFCSYHKGILEEIQNWIHHQIGMNCGTITHKKNKQGSTHQYIIGGNRMFVLVSKLIYSDVSLGLKRKTDFVQDAWHTLYNRRDGRSKTKYMYRELLTRQV